MSDAACHDSRTFGSDKAEIHGSKSGKNMASGKVSISRVLIEGEYRFRVNYSENGKRKRKVCESKAKAEAEAQRIRKDSAQVGSGWLDVPPQDRQKLLEIWRQTGGNISTIKAHQVESRTLSKTIAELISAKESAGRDAGYRDSLKLVLNQFASGREAVSVDAITLSDVEMFLNSKSLAYRSTLRSRISTLFNFCVRRGYCIKNPCDQLEPVTYQKPPPQIFTPKQLEKALEWLTGNPRGMTWFVLTALCGLRPEEAQKTERAKIQCLAGHIIVDVQTTKVRERRVVTPMPEAMRWLRRSLKYGGEIPLPDQFKTRLVRRLRHKLGFERWPKDITRHTAASIWLARVKSAAEVAEQLGNSEKVLKRDYKALVTQKLLDEYLGVITPPPSYRRPK